MSGSRYRPLAVAAVVAIALAAGAGVAVLSAGGDDGSARTVGSAAATLPMPPEQAAAQLFLVGFGGTTGSDPGVRRLAGRDWGGVVIERGNATSAAGVRALVAAIRRRARAAGREEPLVAIRQAGGEASALPRLPPVPQPEQAVAREAALQATAAARALEPLGIDLTLAPVADLAGAVGPAAMTGFSPDPAIAADLVAAAVHAYREAGMASAPGSFPGQGAASGDPRLGPATVGLDLETLTRADLRPFAAAAREAPVMQMSDAVYAMWDGVTPATLAPEAYDLLRRGAGFGGVALSGDLTAVTAVTGGTTARAAVDALRAGADLLWVPGDAADQEAAYEAVLAGLRRDPALRARAAEALARVRLLRERYAR
ncbi:MAG TPA: glycoside hydrolase family 3 N-terminal domain-containing protein [Capillimicrobium sp.]|nr:glycoside hydrolase family 3 N-terminal domain-containing protein [Capillimicrobium sp.]